VPLHEALSELERRVDKTITLIKKYLSRERKVLMKDSVIVQNSLEEVFRIENWSAATTPVVFLCLIELLDHSIGYSAFVAIRLSTLSSAFDQIEKDIRVPCIKLKS